MFDPFYLAKLFSVVVISYFIMSFLGYVMHFLLHQKFTGPFYKAHLNHHNIQYPPGDYYSDKYRYAGKDSTVILFLVAFSPLLIILLLSTLFSVLNLSTSITIFVVMIAVGLANNFIHDQSHVTNSLANKLANRLDFFDKIVKLHIIHHEDVTKNLGIFNFTFDKLFKSYKNSD